MRFAAAVAVVACLRHPALGALASDEAPRRALTASIKEGSYTVLLTSAPAAAADAAGTSASVMAAQLEATTKTLNAMHGITVKKSLPKIGVIVVDGPPNSAANIKKAAGPNVEAVVPTFVFKAPALAFEPASRRKIATNINSAEKSKSESNLRGGKLVEPDLTPLQWSRKAIKVDRAAKAGLKGGGKRPARVAIIDGGFWLDHPAIARYNRELSFNFVPREKLMFNPALTEGGTGKGLDLSHGTHTASIVGGADLGGQGTIGVAPEAELVLLKVLSEESGSGYDYNILAAIIYATTIKADIINMSLGVTLDMRGVKGEYTAADVQYTKRIWSQAVKDAYNSGVTIVGAAGEGDKSINMDKASYLYDFPTSVPYVVGVSATGPVFWGRDQSTPLDKLAVYSYYGSKVIDFAAPGGNTKVAVTHPKAECSYKLSAETTVDLACRRFDYVVSACCGPQALFPLDAYGFKTRYGWLAGTSMASPHVAGVAALIVGKAGRRVPPQELLGYLQQCTNDIGDAGKDAKYGFGRINAGKVVDLKIRP
eukprot:TRINITY_DN81_c0_g3_i4.p1 TRINITY_DN81_c0_g3~~TRINITY_DN81_c0_g3_i4.p1  ORF type:complete len:539 (+),score=155.45 TRINITY_DN81_c0_g3_i4:1588-3204(+)